LALQEVFLAAEVGLEVGHLLIILLCLLNHIVLDTFLALE
jgi:hypothetical protein